MFTVLGWVPSRENAVQTLQRRSLRNSVYLCDVSVLFLDPVRVFQAEFPGSGGGITFARDLCDFGNDIDCDPVIVGDGTVGCGVGITGQRYYGGHEDLRIRRGAVEF